MFDLREVGIVKSARPRDESSSWLYTCARKTFITGRSTQTSLVETSLLSSNSEMKERTITRFPISCGKGRKQIMIKIHFLLTLKYKPSLSVLSLCLKEIRRTDVHRLLLHI